MSNSCTCPLAGFCDRHVIEKHEHWHSLCQTNELYREAWDGFRGPGQFNLKSKPLSRIRKIKEKVAKDRRIEGWIRSMRTPDDTGLGDTVIRLKRLTKSKEVKAHLRTMLQVQACDTGEAVRRLNEKHRYDRLTDFELKGRYCAPLVNRKPRAIVTLAVDDHLPVLDITRPLMQAYAERVGAEFIEITDDHYPQWPMDNKWRVRSYAWHYERTLFLDSDVLIMPDSPNIFEQETAPICVRDEQADYASREGWNDKELSEMFASQRIVGHKLQRFLNGGVILMDYETAQLYSEPPLPCPRTWCLDQHWLQYRIESSGVEVGWLDDRWNWGFIRPDFFEGIGKAWFVHLNGSRDLSYRVELAKRIVVGDYSYFRPPSHVGWIPLHNQ